MLNRVTYMLWVLCFFPGFCNHFLCGFDFFICVFIVCVVECDFHFWLRTFPWKNCTVQKRQPNAISCSFCRSLCDYISDEWYDELLLFNSTEYLSRVRSIEKSPGFSSCVLDVDCGGICWQIVFRFRCFGRCCDYWYCVMHARRVMYEVLQMESNHE